MKKICTFFIVACLFFFGFLFECSNKIEAKSNDAPGLPSNFIVVEEADASMGWTGTVVDRDTNVVYLYSIYTTNVFPEVELVPLYNPDGSLKVCQYD